MGAAVRNERHRRRGGGQFLAPRAALVEAFELPEELLTMSTVRQWRTLRIIAQFDANRGDG